MRILILGGTSEASELVRLLADDTRFRVTLSFAGRTATATKHDVETRVGGFGGVDGLAGWLAQERVDALVDATHPFAGQISANARAAATRIGVPLCTILRPPWQPAAGDLWTIVPDGDAAAATLGEQPRRVFLSIGRQGVGAFAAAPHHTYLIRSIEAPEAGHLPPHVELIAARAPFDVASEMDLLRAQRIDVLVSKNSGGEATYAKIEAARARALPVVMIERPIKAHGDLVTTAAGAYAWLQARHDAGPRSDRAV